MKEKSTCTMCGFRCSAILSSRGGRLLQDKELDLYLSEVPIEDCKARVYIKKGVPKHIARGVVMKGDRIS